MFVMSFQGSPPIIDLRGQPEGTGGVGQMGGTGGVGQHGSPASGRPFECHSGAGYGGNGGSGEPGGLGGRGGTGGKGGIVAFVLLPSAFPTLLELVRANVGPGDGGLGGAQGQRVRSCQRNHSVQTARSNCWTTLDADTGQIQNGL